MGAAPACVWIRPEARARSVRPAALLPPAAAAGAALSALPVCAAPLPPPLFALARAVGRMKPAECGRPPHCTMSYHFGQLELCQSCRRSQCLPASGRADRLHEASLVPSAGPIFFAPRPLLFLVCICVRMAPRRRPRPWLRLYASKACAVPVHHHRPWSRLLANSADKKHPARSLV